jgi:hypothetical protein
VAWGGLDVRGDESIYGTPEFTRAAAGDPIVADRRMLAESVDHVVRDPAGVLGLLPRKLLNLLKGPSAFGLYYRPHDPAVWPVRGAMLVFYGLAMLAGAAGVVLGWRRVRWGLLPLLLPPAYLATLTLLTIPAQRFMLPAMPFVMVLAALPLSAVMTARLARRRTPVEPAGAAGLSPPYER